MSSTVAEITQICAGLAGVALTVGLVLAMLQNQIGVASGAPGAIAHTTEQIIAIIVCFAVALAAPDVGKLVSGVVGAATSSAGIISVGRELGGFVVRIAISGAGVLMAVFTSSTAVGTQLATMLGRPSAGGAIMARLGMVIISGVLTLLSLQLANLIITAAH